eukprot:29571-Pelagococcus_subviridis.AAC.1
MVPKRTFVTDSLSAASVGLLCGRETYFILFRGRPLLGGRLTPPPSPPSVPVLFYLTRASSSSRPERVHAHLAVRRVARLPRKPREPDASAESFRARLINLSLAPFLHEDVGRVRHVRHVEPRGRRLPDERLERLRLPERRHDERERRFVSPRRRFGFRILKRGAVRRQRAQRGQESGEQRGVVTHVRGDHLV